VKNFKKLKILSLRRFVVDNKEIEYCNKALGEREELIIITSKNSRMGKIQHGRGKEEKIYV